MIQVNPLLTVQKKNNLCTFGCLKNYKTIFRYNSYHLDKKEIDLNNIDELSNQQLRKLKRMVKRKRRNDINE